MRRWMLGCRAGLALVLGVAGMGGALGSVEFLPTVPESANGTLRAESNGAVTVLRGDQAGYCDDGAGIRMAVLAPEAGSAAEAIGLRAAAGTECRLVEMVARQRNGSDRASWSTGVLLPALPPGDGVGELPELLIRREQFTPTPGTEADGPLPTTDLILEMRIGRRTGRLGSGPHLAVGGDGARWVPLGIWPGAEDNPELIVRPVGSDEGRTTVPLGRLTKVDLSVRSSGGSGLGPTRIWIEGPDRDLIEHEDVMEVDQGRATLAVWPRKAGSFTLHLLEVNSRRRATLIVDAREPESGYAVYGQVEGFLGRNWITANTGFSVSLTTTAPLESEPVQAVHMAVRDLFGRALFARWFTPAEFASEDARLIVPGMGLHTVELAATTVPIEQLSQLPQEVSLLPELHPVKGSREQLPWALRTDWVPDGVTTRSHMGLLLVLEEIPSTVPLVARDRFRLIVNSRSPSENALYPFPIGIEGAGQLTGVPINLSRSLAATHRRLGSFWSAEELDFAVAVPGPGIRIWTVPDRVWPVRKSEYTRVAMVLRGLAKWEGGAWPVHDEVALREWRGWLAELKSRFQQVSMWMVGRDLDRPGLEPSGLWRKALSPEDAARLVMESSGALSGTNLPYRLGVGGTDGFRPWYLDRLLSLLNPVPERLQTLAFRMRPIGQGLLPDGNDFGEIAGIHRHLLRKRDLGSKEAWWMPVGFGSHPGGLAPVGQSAALGQTFAIGQVNRISKMFWTQLADGEAFHPANPKARSGLLDYRLRPKPSLAAFLINTFLLTRLENPREESVPGMLLKDPATTSSVMISALNFDIAVHSLKRSGGLTIAWTTGNEGRLVSKEAALEGLERELNGNGFPPSAWPLPTEHGSVALYPYQSRMGGPVFAISMHGTLVQPVRVTRTGVTKLGPTGLYLFPVGPAPLYIWDTGLDWGEGQPTPE